MRRTGLDLDAFLTFTFHGERERTNEGDKSNGVACVLGAKWKCSYGEFRLSRHNNIDKQMTRVRERNHSRTAGRGEGGERRTGGHSSLARAAIDSRCGEFMIAGRNVHADGESATWPIDGSKDANDTEQSAETTLHSDMWGYFEGAL